LNFQNGETLLQILPPHLELQSRPTLPAPAETFADFGRILRNRKEIAGAFATAMRFHHTAALALVGWYLITAPVSDHGAIIYQDAPLSQWTKSLRFNSESDCEAKRQEVIDDSQNAVALVPDSDVDEDSKRDATNAVNQALVSRCVEDDDPRLSSSGVPVGVPKKLIH
jgi:hypothetical protein